jgi:transposase InsO family protein
MRWSKLCTIDGRSIAAASSTIAIGAALYDSIKYTERLAETGIGPSVGSVGDSYDSALAETINGLYKAEVTHRRGPWRSFEAVELAPSNGSTGSTTEGSWSRSATYRPQRPSNATAPCWNNWPWRRKAPRVGRETGFACI